LLCVLRRVVDGLQGLLHLLGHEWIVLVLLRLLGGNLHGLKRVLEGLLRRSLRLEEGVV
jgi:hypothetical protein